ncbi:MAG TPA: hypothetical protein VM366_18780 [Anaerolineae bacterium]|nr:hypothetical protein [Anaerolineae bacterium]
MERTKRSGMAVGAVLIIIGAWLLIVQFIPALRGWFSWPTIIIAVGLLLFLLGLFLGEYEMAIPGCIVGGIGGILFWQNTTGNWESWSYIWALIPGFAGTGTLIAGLSRRDGGQVRGGLWTMLVSAVLFLVFGSLFGAIGVLGQYWPVLLIVLGLFALVQGLTKRG